MSTYKSTNGFVDLDALDLRPAIVPDVTGSADDCVLIDRIDAGARWRRAADIATALAGIIIFAVPMLIIGTLVAATSRGHILFSQTRVGRNGAPIRVLKFRSMCDGAQYQLECDDHLHSAYVANDFKLDGHSDPRITTFGRLLRKTSLDELPQLWNVLRGDMSIVGIRPLLFEELALRPERDQELYRVLQPGMTGLWQVRGRSSVDAVDRSALDRQYVEEWSLWNDVKIILATPLAVLRIQHTH